MAIAARELEQIRQDALRRLALAGIAVRPDEATHLDVADFSLSRFRETGLVELVYVNNDRYAAKELILLPQQTCPEHWHPPVGPDPGKQETFRCRAGTVHLYIDGPPTARPQAEPPAADRAYYTVRHEVALTPGDQFTIQPGVAHWFQAGHDGAVVSEFSSPSRDETDQFRDPRIRWQPQ